MSPPAGVDVLTRSYQISRSGSNTNETVLTPAAVASGLRKIFSVIVTGDPAHPDDPRIEAQPLIVTGLRMNDGRVHDALYVCTMNNNVWAFDANDGSRIWAAPVSLGNPVTPKVTPTDKSPTATEIDMWGINIHWGILSTPVIDRETETLYVVIWTSPDGSIPAARYELHAISLIDGKERPHSPKKIEARVTVDGVTTVFQPPRQKLRAALLLLPSENAHVRPAGAPPVLSGGHGDHEHSPAGHGVLAELPNRSALIIACSQFGESSSDQHGWVLAYDTTSLEQTAAFCTTPTTGGGGIWQAGQGPAGDHGGNVYIITSNGGWNGITDFAETFLMLHYSPPRAGKSGKLELTSWFTPFRDAERDSTPAYDFKDQDLGSAGPVVPSGMHMVFGAGKDGVLYVLQKGDFGNTTRAQIDSHTQFHKLKSPPIFFTCFPGFNVDPTDTHALDHNFFEKTHHLHGSPVFWDSPDHGPMLYCWGENETLRAWAVEKDGKVTFKARGREIASEGAQSPLGGMPGGMLTLSAHPTNPHSGLVWATVPINGDGNRRVVDGIMRVYDATDFEPVPNEDARLKLLWDTRRVPVDFKYNKFCPPLVANGKVYVTTYEGRIDVYGL